MQKNLALTQMSDCSRVTFPRKYDSHDETTKNTRALYIVFQRIGVWVTAEDIIHVFDAAKVWADGNVLHCAAMFTRGFSRVPRAGVLSPNDITSRGCEIDIHIGAI